MSDKEVTVVELTPEQQQQEAAAALSAGYNKVRGETVETEPNKVTEEVKTEAVEPEKKAPVVETPPDPLTELRQELQGIKGTLSTFGAFTKEFKDHKAAYGRIAASLQRLEAAKEAAKAVETAPTQAQIDAAAKDPEKWEALKKDFEEWTQATEDYVKQKLAAERAETLKQIPKVDVDGIKKEVGESVTGTMADAVAKARAEAVKEARQLVVIDQKYPTWEEDVHVYAQDGKVSLTPEFSAWMDAQAPEVKALAHSNLARDALKMLDLYYEHKKADAKKETNKQRLAAAVTPQQASSGGPTVLPDEAGLSVGYNRVKKRA